MSEAKINSALVQAVLTASFGPPCAFENDPTNANPVANTPWMKFRNVPASKLPSSNGVGGYEEHIGFIQLDFNVALNTGTAALLAYSDAALAYFPPGKRFIYNEQCVLVTRSERSPIRPVDGWARVSVTVYYSSQSTRPEV